MRDLIVHEWIEPIGGSEKVVEHFARLLPAADIFTLWDNAPGRMGRPAIESPLARTPVRRSKPLAIPVMSASWRHFDARAYDRALISTHSFAHHLGGGRCQQHLDRYVYVHSPARWIWARSLDPRGAGLAARLAVPLLQRHDRRHVVPGSFASNSAFVAERVRKAWGVESGVVYPPVEQMSESAGPLDADDEALLAGLPGEYVLGASRFIDYKRLDLVIRFGEAVGMPVVLAGSGPLEDELRRLGQQAGVLVHVLHRPSDAALRALFERAQVYVFPAIEDFGIMPIEANMLGTPTVVNRIGGAAEAAAISEGGVTVGFGDDASPAAWREAFAEAKSLRGGFAERAAEKFGVARFDREILEWIGGP